MTTQRKSNVKVPTVKPSSEAVAPEATTKGTNHKARLGGGAMEVDQKLVETAVAKINQLHRGKCEAIGEYLLREFFNDDIANYRENPDNLTFYELRRRNDLEVPYSSLCMILKTMEQREVLGEELAGMLDYSHQTRLLSVKNPERKLELAQQAADGTWTVKHLDAQIASTKGRSAGGKLTTARVESCFTKLNGAVKKLQGPEMVKFLKEIDAAERENLLKKIGEEIKELQKLQKVLSDDSKK